LASPRVQIGRHRESARSALHDLGGMPWSEQQCNWLKCMLSNWAMVVNISSPLAVPMPPWTATAEIIARCTQGISGSFFDEFSRCRGARVLRARHDGRLRLVELYM
jgi:hypothetical protein